ncbi:MAG: DNA polymerase [Sulfuricaulis sp.]|nr:DNA polymerase [Sulfuricaulis sp.]
MTTEAYVRDPRFEEILLGVKDGDAPAYWLLPDRAAAFLAEEVDWANTAVIAHHAHFDGFILSHHHKIKPALWIDTLSMARVLDGPKAGNSLHDLCIRHNIGTKGDFVTHAKGKHLKDFTRDELFQYGAYCANDCEKEYLLAMKFMDQMPAEELQIIDRVVRCFTEPVFVGNSEALRSAVASERQRKQDVLRRIGLICPHCQGTGVVPDLIAGTVQCKKCDGQGTDKKTIGSNEQLATLFRACGIEPQTKTSPSTGEQIYAFAKTDSAMQEMLEDEYEDVRFLAEARIAIKSNIVETRAEKFAACAERGPMPVYISYGAAHTFRMGGGDGMNWLNISSKHNANRPELSVIAASIMAPPGHKIVTADSGQGEARITAWLAGQHDLVDAFAQGRDVYSEHASTIYGRPIDRKRVKEDYIPGQLGKVCLAEGTLVVTNHGTKPIERVTIKDTLWDGEKWVQHRGLIFQGVKEIVEGASLRATTDHEILTGHGWRTWNEVRMSHSLFRSALDLVNLPFSVGGVWQSKEKGMSTVHCVVAHAAPNRTCADTISKAVSLVGATSAQKEPRLKNGGGVMQMLCSMWSTACGCLIDCLPLLAGVTTQKIKTSGIMANGGFVFIQSGRPTAPHFCDTSRPSPDGMTPHWKWTAAKWTGTMNRAISGLLLAPSTCKTSDKLALCSDESKNSKQKMRTYDLACAGPRHRFAVLTDQGPIIVHNCILGMGFGMGYYKASMELLKGMLGAPPIQFTTDDMAMLRVDPSRFLNNPAKVKQVDAMPSRLSLNARLIHCAVTNALIERYRAKMSRITGVGLPPGELGYWQLMDQVIDSMIWGKEMVFGAHGVMRTAKDKIWMPNGLAMRFDGLERGNDGRASYYNGRERVELFGAKLVENTVQCLHYIVVSRQLLEIAKVLKVAITTYDDVVTVVREDIAADALAFMIEEMSKTPAWATGLPLVGEGKIGSTLKEAS